MGIVFVLLVNVMCIGACTCMGVIMCVRVWILVHVCVALPTVVVAWPMAGMLWRPLKYHTVR